MEFNIDNKDVLEECCSALNRPETKNFCVEFNNSQSQCVIDLDEVGFSRKLQTSSLEGSCSVRWIHLWSAKAQQAAVTAVAEHYGISTRIRGLLHVSRIQHNTFPVMDLSRSTGSRARRPQTARHESSIQARVAENEFNHVVDELWHFNAVSRDVRYLYIGFNSLYAPVESASTSSQQLQAPSAPSRPFELRMWTSIIVGHDGTVVSIVEDLPEYASPDLLKHAAAITRRNVINIFRNLSSATTPTDAASTLSLVEIRSYLNGHSSGVNHATSMLCYYIFDDWYTAFAMVTGKHNPYRRELEQARRAMFERPNIALISSLHRTGQQLTRLKLIYQSYSRIIHQLLAFHGSQHLRLAPKDIHPLPDMDEADNTLSRPASLLDLHFGHDHVSLTPPSLLRFERLLDQISLLALAEIQDAISEKESLVLMNFNLIALGESRAIERLTKITIVLAKVTIVFLPLGLLTDYFGMEIEAIKRMNSVAAYWVSFVIVAFLAGLFVVTVGSSTTRTWASIDGSMVGKAEKLWLELVGNLRKRR